MGFIRHWKFRHGQLGKANVESLQRTSDSPISFAICLIAGIKSPRHRASAVSDLRYIYRVRYASVEFAVHLWGLLSICGVRCPSDCRLVRSLAYPTAHVSRLVIWRELEPAFGRCQPIIKPELIDRNHKRLRSSIRRDCSKLSASQGRGTPPGVAILRLKE